MEYNNGLNRSISRINAYPRFLQAWLLDNAIGNTVKYVGTSGIHFEKMTCLEVVVSLKNRRKVQNHIHQLHAAATTLLAETATGMVVGMNIPDDKIPLMKNLSVKFIKRSQGAQTAVASLSEEQINIIRTTEKGDVNVPVKVTDETGKEVIIAEMNWAWIPKNK
ncbi:MAG: acyl-coenzyme A thioesterase PaaI-like protein [Arcticibacterium sp.]|jgi:acyl-coenzyme A thioesterase PaaI-like protein